MPQALVVVSGLPAAGKSTLARRIGTDLGFVVVCRDRLKIETGLHDIAAVLPSDSWTLVPAALDRIINFIVAAVLDAGHGAVVDGNFNWREQREPVRDLFLERHPLAAEVCLWGDAPVLKERFRARNDPPMDEHLSMVFDRAVRRPREPVLGPPVPTFEFDTTDIKTIDDAYPDLLSSIRESLGLEPSKLVGA